MTNYSKNNTLLKSALMAGGLAAGALGATSNSAEAMILHNCSNVDLRIALQNKDGNYNRSQMIPSGATKSIPAVVTMDPHRIVMVDFGEGAWFSGRKATGTYSLVNTSDGGGNVTLANGNACQRTKPIDNGGGNGGGQGDRVCFEGVLGRVCLEN